MWGTQSLLIAHRSSPHVITLWPHLNFTLCKCQCLTSGAHHTPIRGRRGQFLTPYYMIEPWPHCNFTTSPLVFTKPVVLLQIHHIEIMAHFATEYRSTLRPKWESHCIVNCEKVHVTALWRPWTSTLWSEHISPTQLCWPVLWLLGYNRRSGDQLRRSRGENPIKQMMTLSPVHGSCPVAPARWCSEPRPLGDQSSKLHLRATILCLSDQLKSDQSWLAYKQSDL